MVLCYHPSMIEGGGDRRERKPRSLTVEQVCARLDTTNNNYAGLVHCFETVASYNRSATPFFYEKDVTLPDLVLQLRAEGEWPIIDKNLGIVVCPYAHEWVKAQLYAYHKNIAYEHRKRDEYADAWVQEGMGWYQSSLGGVRKSKAYVGDASERRALKLLGVNRF